MQSEVDMVGVGDALEHGLGLPPGLVGVGVHVGEVVGGVGQAGHRHVAHLARLRTVNELNYQLF